MKHIFDHVDSRRIGLDISSQCNVSQRPPAREIPNALGEKVEKQYQAEMRKKRNKEAIVEIQVYSFFVPQQWRQKGHASWGG